MNKNVEAAAKRFYHALVTDYPGPFEYTDHKAKPLIVAAFMLYAKAWAPFNVTEWQWPISTLSAGEPFDGDDPWTVLLRRAVEIARPAETADRLQVPVVDSPEEPWSIADTKAAEAEGWNLFDCGANGLQIQRDDEAATFPDDDAAKVFVFLKAVNGSGLHMRAITIDESGEERRAVYEGDEKGKWRGINPNRPEGKQTTRFLYDTKEEATAAASDPAEF